MRRVEVDASRSYEVLIGRGLLAGLGQEVRRVCKAEKVAIVSDSNVWPLYGEAVKASLGRAGLEVVRFVFPAGEESKNGTVFLELVDFLAREQMTRSDCLVALGGGVVGDLTGFASATYLRGIACVQVPTTLLAAVDSSVGGKTAIDLPAGKNLCGAFCQPRLVVCDLDTLDTLPEDIFRDGCAEVIKYGILYDEDLFRHLEEQGLRFDREAVVARCVELKRDVVMEDEFDTGARMKLNLGHTVGHGVEAQSRFTVSHGKAVAIGMAIVARTAAGRGICQPEVRDRIVGILERFGLPVGTAFGTDALYRSALSDKKRSGGRVDLIVPERIGSCKILPTPVGELRTFIEEGL
ncbi:MAG: 3-dehydroquinate synthase [Oscillospiraceae bacterium]|nr:3-dehydroquinate synthase [Oscillospiraceae bacterium]